MDLYLQIFLLGACLACVCSQFVPNHAQLTSYLRRRRDALPSPLHHHQNEYGNSLRFKNHIYNIENENSYGNDADSHATNENQNVFNNHPQTFNNAVSTSDVNHSDAPAANRRVFDDKIVAKRYAQPHFEEEEHYAPPKYNFKYTVHDVEHRDIKHHQEERDGDNTVGEYSVLQPDGTILTVRYTVHGDEGFNAVVSKSEYEHHFEH